MKRSTQGIIAIIILAIIVVGGYAIFHNPSNYNNNNGSGASQTSGQAKTPTIKNDILMTKTDPTLGQYLADPSGRPLYTYGSDTSGVSNCTGSCLSNWPAYQPSSTTVSLPSGISTIKRADNGQTQYTYNGLPLYYFTGDSNGAVTGNGVENFHIAKPASVNSQQSTTPASNSPYSGY